MVPPYRTFTHPMRFARFATAVEHIGSYLGRLSSPATRVGALTTVTSSRLPGGAEVGCSARRVQFGSIECTDSRALVIRGAWT